jgi:hypothetical protein
MKDANADSGSPDQENENSPPENSQEPDPPFAEEESLNSDTETGFEEQEGEVLPPEEKKKSRAGKLFLFMLLLLSGSGGYLYFNNLIPAEYLNLISPKSAPPKSSALIAEVSPTPLVIEEEVVEITETPDMEIAEAKDSEMPVIAPSTEAPQETTHISGSSAEPVESARISGNSFEPVRDAEQEEDIPELASVEEPEVVADEEVIEAQETKPMMEAITPPHEELPTSKTLDTPEPVMERNESVQAYLDFIESSLQKFGELIKEGFNRGWDYIKG